MMRLLRIKLFKNTLSMILLSVMLIKVGGYVIAHFRASADPLAIEKSADDSKDTKEEAFDKKEKKHLSCHSLLADQGHFLWINNLPIHIYSLTIQSSSDPSKAVPTPPPNHIA
jgi:hypothetical protein